MTELKPCPFCGGEAKIFTFGLERYRTIGCSECGVQSPVYETIEQAIEAWNNRPSPWHTGTPTEDGWYLQCIKSKNKISYDTDYYENGDWKYSCVFREIVAWQKIDPPQRKQCEA